jgi:cellulose synthase/poly-beta-1,6-N-acetylglucosamine synthase-like glycosyltransferase
MSAGGMGCRGKVAPLGGDMAIRAEVDAPIHGARGETAAAARRLAPRGAPSFLSHAPPGSRRGPRGSDNHAGGTVRNMAADPTTVARREAMAHDAAARQALAAAIGRVEAVDPSFSARRTFTPRQAAVAVLTVTLAGMALVLWPVPAIFALELGAAAFFFAVSFVRFLAAQILSRRAPPRLPRRIRNPPVYTVLVPLRHEAHMMGQIVGALDRLCWPRHRLDIKLVIDADDTGTLAAARAVATAAPYEVIEVPAGGPRTKPMALQYALGFARGAFVTVYDAEDRPHPLQLAEAYVAFCRGDDDLACLQAPLVIDNAGRSPLAALFAIEYAALFDGLLPALGRLRLPLPLGGTSNHFRRAALEAVGAWDPYNVTEDADLGIRLTRFGYRTGTLTLPTLEEAPERLGPWLRQRTRWQKGWLQTWLVHMRHPVRLWREIGARQMAGFNALGLGMVVAMLAHPFFLATPVLILLDPGRFWGHGALVAGLAGLALFNLAFGYAAMALLAGRALALRRRELLAAYIWLLPLYWLLMGLACLMAIRDLFLRPHGWNKTPHVGTTLNGRPGPRPP